MVLWVADQDVVNRYYAEHHDDGSVDLIPCDWSCDFNSCQKNRLPAAIVSMQQNVEDIISCPKGSNTIRKWDAMNGIGTTTMTLLNLLIY